MNDKVKIESLNKISQIYSVDIHCNPLICDLRLDVEKTVSSKSELMMDIKSAKANAYAKAKGEFKIDVIVDPSYIIKQSFSNAFYRFISTITFGLSRLGLRFEVSISGYAGYYTNPRSYYEHQKQLIQDLANASQKVLNADINSVEELKSILQPEFSSSHSQFTDSILKEKGVLSVIPLIGKLF